MKALIRSALILLVSWPSASPAADFTLAFDSCPPALQGSPGQIFRFETLATLTTSRNSSPAGAHGWSLIVSIDAGEFRSISLEGLQASTIYDHDRDPSTPLLDPYRIDLLDADFRVAQLIPRQEGARRVYRTAISAMLLRTTERMTLQPEGTVRVLRLEVETTIPARGVCEPLHIRQEPVFSELGGEPVIASVVFDGSSHTPTLASCTIPRCPPPFRRGDSNADARVDISDAIADLAFLYLGETTPGCLETVDANGDGALDISDPIFLLEVLFGSGGAPIPAPGPLRCGLDDGPDAVACARYAGC